MGNIGQKCPFCGEHLVLDSVKINGTVPSVVYCDNDECSTKPCTEYGTASKVLAEAKFFGTKEDYLEQLETNDCCYNCKHNRNNLTIEYTCDCLFKNRSNVQEQYGNCDDYERID